jgi:hypothetical protein
MLMLDWQVLSLADPPLCPPWYGSTISTVGTLLRQLQLLPDAVLCCAVSFDRAPAHSTGRRYSSRYSSLPSGTTCTYLHLYYFYLWSSKF